MQGHSTGSKRAELWGAACHPNQQRFATCGADRCIRVWSEVQQIAASAPFEDEVYSIDWSPCGSFLVVGDARGQVHSVDATSLEVSSVIKHKSRVPGKEPWV